MATLRNDIAPLFDVVWVTEAVHEAALDRVFAEGRRGLSLVDACSFVVASKRGIHRAFAYDRHFEEAGLSLVR